MECVLCVLIELIDCPCSQGRVLYTVINQVAGNTSGWDVWALNFNMWLPNVTPNMAPLQQCDSQM